LKPPDRASNADERLEALSKGYQTRRENPARKAEETTVVEGVTINRAQRVVVYRQKDRTNSGIRQSG